MICLSLSTHENTVIRAAAMEALANTYIALKLCYPNESASTFYARTSIILLN